MMTIHSTVKDMAHPLFDLTGLPHRPEKPRKEGITVMLDKGLPNGQLEDALETVAEFVDFVKLGWGTAVVTPGLRRKLDVYRAAGIPVFFGGTLFEAFYLREGIDAYRRLLHHLGLKYMQVSDETLSIPQEEKLELIRGFTNEFRVFSEVGSTDDVTLLPPYKWVRSIRAELEAGSSLVICEARESGTVGLFRPNGEVRSGLVDEIVDMIGPERIVFEAPRKSQQVWFIKHIGPNVNLGNISHDEVIPLETLRLGLRGDTLLDFIAP